MIDKMKNLKFFTLIMLFSLGACVDNTLDENPTDEKFPFRIILDQEEGGDLPDAEDYGIEVAFADFARDLPEEPLTIGFRIAGLEDDMEGAVEVDKVIYEVELDDCTFERELDFTINDDLTGTITLVPDADLGGLPESFEVVLTLPGSDDTEGSFVFELTSVTGSDRVVLGFPNIFEYEVLDTDVAGDWELELDEEQFEEFKRVFGPISSELDEISFEDVTGNVTVSFEYSEVTFAIELKETEEVTSCEDGEVETEVENKVIEIEAEYSAEDGEIVFEGSHLILGDDGEPEDELDFLLEGTYSLGEGSILFRFINLVDEDNFDQGEELFFNEEGIVFQFFKD